MNYITYEVNVKGTSETKEEAAELMKTLALKFMAYEEGERKAKIITTTPFTHENIPKGYILFAPDSTKIDVYYKENQPSSFMSLFNKPSLIKIEAYTYTKINDNNDNNEMEIDE